IMSMSLLRSGCRLEAHLAPDDEGVFGFAGAVRISVEHGALAVGDVLEIGGQVPVETDRPRFSLGARAWGREAERERAVVHLQRVVARSDLEGAEMAGSEVEMGARP